MYKTVTILDALIKTTVNGVLYVILLDVCGWQQQQGKSNFLMPIRFYLYGSGNDHSS